MSIKEFTDAQKEAYKELILLLREINPNQNFFMGVYHELFTDTEKQQMLIWLKTTKNPSWDEVEVKALEITEPRNAIRRKICGSIGKKVDITYDNGEQYSGYLWEHSFAEDSDIGEESITLSPLGKTYQLELPVNGIVRLEVDPDCKSY